MWAGVRTPPMFYWGIGIPWTELCVIMQVSMLRHRDKGNLLLRDPKEEGKERECPTSAPSPQREDETIWAKSRVQGRKKLVQEAHQTFLFL